MKYYKYSGQLCLPLNYSMEAVTSEIGQTVKKMESLECN